MLAAALAWRLPGRRDDLIDSIYSDPSTSHSQEPSPELPSSQTLEVDEAGEPVLARMTYVDEETCIGCKNCALVARNTFVMNDDFAGKARVFSQGWAGPVRQSWRGGRGSAAARRAAQRVGRHSPRGGGGAAGAVRPVLAGGAARLGEVHGDAAGLASPSWVCQEGFRCSEEWHWWREGKRGEGRWGVRKRALRAAHRRRRGAASDWLLTTWQRASFATLRASAS